MKTSVELDDDLYREARVFAARTGTTLRALIEAGLKHAMSAPPARTDGATNFEALRAIQAQWRAIEIPSHKTDDELLGYDEAGLPT